jgi:hypothetical protein
MRENLGKDPRYLHLGRGYRAFIGINGDPGRRRANLSPRCRATASPRVTPPGARRWSTRPACADAITTKCGVPNWATRFRLATGVNRISRANSASDPVARVSSLPRESAGRPGSGARARWSNTWTRRMSGSVRGLGGTYEARREEHLTPYPPRFELSTEERADMLDEWELDPIIFLAANGYLTDREIAAIREKADVARPRIGTDAEQVGSNGVDRADRRAVTLWDAVERA